MYDELVKTLRLRAALWEKMYDEDNVLKQAADAIEELQGRAKVLEKVADKWCEAVPKWIPVTEKLPERGKLCIVYRYSDRLVEPYITTALLLSYRDWSLSGVTHWMPLPEPPKEE